MLRSFLARLRQSSSQASAQPNYDVPATPGEVAFAWAQVQRFNPDVVIANRTWLANLLDPLQAPTLKVIYTHDVIHQRMTSFDEHNLDSGLVGWDKQKESAFLRKAHVLLAIQEEDAETLREMAPSCEVMCIPMSASVHEPTAPQVPARCLFVGADATQNIHGLEWFLEEVWPLVLAAKPECSLHVCGSVESRFRGRRFPRVRFLGIVDDLSKEYSEAQVCLVPLLVGSGLKVKLVEALSYGRACVSTSVGMQGLRKLSGEAVLVADSPQTFARGVDAVLSDDEKRYQMEQKAMAYVVRHLSPTAVYGEFVNRIQQHVAAMT